MKKVIIPFVVILTLLITSCRTDIFERRFTDWHLIYPQDKPLYQFAEKEGFTNDFFDYVGYEKTDSITNEIKCYLAYDYENEEITKEELEEIVKSLSMDEGFLLEKIKQSEVSKIYHIKKNTYESLIMVETNNEFIYIFINV